MSDTTTPNLALPLIAAAQAQKHVTHNEALLRLDTITQLTVTSARTVVPPAAARAGERYIVPPEARDAWSGWANAVAVFEDGGWTRSAPSVGWRAWIADERRLVVFDGQGWRAAALDPGAGLDNLARLGVNATSDETNRLAVRSSASLFDNVGRGHQLKVNRQGASDTAGLVFQTAYAGRVEIGLLGDDRLRIKTSGNGVQWVDALVIAPTGQVGLGVVPDADLHLSVSRNGAVSQKIENRATGATATAGIELATGAPDCVASLSLTTAGTLTLQSGPAVGTAVFAVEELRIRSRAGTDRVVVAGGTGHVLPGQDNAQSLGSATRRWTTVFAATGTVTTSDARDKTVVGDLTGFAGAMVDAVAPVLYYPGTEVGEVHAGFLAQDIRAAMDLASRPFAAWGLDDPSDVTSRQWLRTSELIPVLWQALRETRTRLTDAESRLERLAP